MLARDVARLIEDYRNCTRQLASVTAEWMRLCVAGISGGQYVQAAQYLTQHIADLRLWLSHSEEGRMFLRDAVA